jgi:hypothetical protein
MVPDSNLHHKKWVVCLMGQKVKECVYKCGDSHYTKNIHFLRFFNFLKLL